MRAVPNPPTLLVFTLGAEAESRRRPLLPAAAGEHEVELRRACLEAALAAGREAGCAVEVSSPRPLEVGPGVGHAPQGEGPFGRRLDRAFSDCLARRGGPVAVVGTDVPGLAAGHLRRAFDALDEDPDRVVVGPSPDGGFYLLAAARPIEGLSSAVSWCCGSTRATLLAALAAAGREVVLLAPLADLDRPADLERWLAGRAGSLAGWRRLVARLRRVLAARRRLPIGIGSRTPRLGFAAAVPARGPPAAAPL